MIRLFADSKSLAEGAADFFVEQARKAVKARKCFSVLLAGGETPRQMYQMLADQQFINKAPWAHIHFFWGDERCVPFDDERSNARMAHDALLDDLPLLPEQIHHFPFGLAPQARADAYQNEMEKFFEGGQPSFDLALLGLGEDGHTASLFPGTDALKEARRWTAVVRKPDEDFSRVTLTAPILNQTRATLFLVTGIRKAQVVREIFRDVPPSGKYPVQLIHPQSGEVQWFIDGDAASLLDA